MASYSVDLDRALDGLGFSYLDGVPFQLDPRIEAVANYDFSRVEALLATPLPSSGLGDHCNRLISKIGSLEEQAIRTLADLEAEKEAKRANDQLEKEELNKLEEEEEEKEERRQEEEVAQKEEQDDDEEASPTEAPPDAVPRLPPANINFSEFEAESDPFEKAELLTLNDMQELAAVLQTSTSTSSSSYSTPPVYSAAASVNSTYFAPMAYQQSYPYYPPVQGYAALPSAVAVEAESAADMKSSKSLGDIMAEIKKEADALEKMKLDERKNSQTPPPRVPKNVMDDWVPWPDLDGSKALSDLAQSSQEVCRQISEMGFSLERVVKGCKSLGDDRQKIINFCLLVDKLAAAHRRFSTAEIEYVIPMHNLDEDLSVKHLSAFHQLEELGFDRVAIHEALVGTKLDHDKALEKLLK